VARFYIGQPVICVDDRLRRGATQRYPGLTWPKAGARYVIRGIIEERFTFVTVREIKNRIIRYPNGVRAEAGFWEERFEPATDIGDFEATLRTIDKYMGSPDIDDDPYPTTAPSEEEIVE
jgi:hypothetical protein